MLVGFGVYLSKNWGHRKRTKSVGVIILRHNLATRMKFCPLTTPEPLGLGSWNFFWRIISGYQGVGIPQNCSMINILCRKNQWRQPTLNSYNSGTRSRWNRENGNWCQQMSCLQKYKNESSRVKTGETGRVQSLRGLITADLDANICSYTGDVIDMSPGSHGNAPRYPKLHFPKREYLW